MLTSYSLAIDENEITEVRDILSNYEDLIAEEVGIQEEKCICILYEFNNSHTAEEFKRIIEGLKENDKILCYSRM